MQRMVVAICYKKKMSWALLRFLVDLFSRCRCRQDVRVPTSQGQEKRTIEERRGEAFDASVFFICLVLGGEGGGGSSDGFLALHLLLYCFPLFVSPWAYSGGIRCLPSCLSWKASPLFFDRSLFNSRGRGETPAFMRNTPKSRVKPAERPPVLE